LLDEYFKEIESKGIKLTEGQKLWYTKKYEMLGDSVKKEYPSTPDEAFEVNMDGLYYASQISVARAQKRIIHIPYDRTSKVHTAWDLGFRDSTSIIMFQILGREIHIIDFVEGTGKSLADYVKMVKDKPYIYGTHLAPHDIAQHEYSTGISRIDTAAKLGINFILTQNLSISDGIDCVRNMFPRIYFSNTDAVLQLVKHIESYSQMWDRSRGMWSGKPDHNEHSHACFINKTKILTINGNKNISEINKGDYVVTPNGNRRVKNIYKKKSCFLKEVRYKNDCVICTPEHEFFTNKGLICADSLRYDITPYRLEDLNLCKKLFGLKSSIQNIGFKENFLYQMMKNQLYTMDINIDGMENIIEQPLQNLGLFQRFIEQFGQKTKEKYQKISIYTIKMVMEKIIQWKILSLYLLQNIQNFIVDLTKKKIYLENQFLLPCNMPKNGILAMRELNGIENMQKKQILEKINYQKFVNNAKKNISELSTIKNTAQISVKQDQDINLGSIQKKENVEYAQKNISSINTHYRKLVLKNAESKNLEYHETYDLEIEDDHCYYANNFLVSNSDALRYLCCGIDFCANETQTITQTEADSLWRQHARRM
jgi:hypothetical protein